MAVLSETTLLTDFRPSYRCLRYIRRYVCCLNINQLFKISQYLLASWIANYRPKKVVIFPTRTVSWSDGVKAFWQDIIIRGVRRRVGALAAISTTSASSANADSPTTLMACRRKLQLLIKRKYMQCSLDIATGSGWGRYRQRGRYIQQWAPLYLFLCDQISIYLLTYMRVFGFRQKTPSSRDGFSHSCSG